MVNAHHYIALNKVIMRECEYFSMFAIFIHGIFPLALSVHRQRETINVLTDLWTLAFAIQF
jgi:hypothetical protein